MPTITGNNKKEVHTNSERILNASIMKLSLMLGEDPEKLLSIKPKITVSEPDAEPYVKYDVSENTIAIHGIKIDENFLKYVINGIIGFHYYKEKMAKRSIHDNDIPSNYSIENILIMSFSSLFGAEASEDENKSATIAPNIFKKSELIDIQNLLSTIIYTYENILSDSFEKFLNNMYDKSNTDQIEMMSRILASVLVIANNGDTIRTLRSIYYNGYAALNSIKKIDMESFSNNARLFFNTAAR